MYPLLATTAISAAGDIVHAIADKIAQGTAKSAPVAAPAVPFSTFINKAGAPTPVSMALRSQDLAKKLGHSPEVAAALNAAGASGPANIQIDASGTSALRMPNGDLKPIQLSEEMRGVARELYHLRQPAPNSATMARPTTPVTVSLS